MLAIRGIVCRVHDDRPTRAEKGGAHDPRRVKPADTQIVLLANGMPVAAVLVQNLQAATGAVLRALGALFEESAFAGPTADKSAPLTIHHSPSTLHSAFSLVPGESAPPPARKAATRLRPCQPHGFKGPRARRPRSNAQHGKTAVGPASPKPAQASGKPAAAAPGAPATRPARPPLRSRDKRCQTCGAPFHDDSRTASRRFCTPAGCAKRLAPSAPSGAPPEARPNRLAAIRAADAKVKARLNPAPPNPEP